MTDNGGTVGVPIFNAGMRGRKVELYEGGHRVPCFIRWPGGGLRGPGDVAELTEVQDVLPTLVELCGLKAPAAAKFDGVSLAPLLRGQVEQLPDRTLVVQFSRMNHPRPEKGDAAVLWKRWRLIQDKELYDLTTDAAQKENVIARFPDVVARMRIEYDRWWAGVAPTVNEFSAIVVGSDAENPIQLSPADWEDSFLDQGAQVRSGLRRNGAWNVIVDRAGEYEIELRRWAREADAPLAAGLPPYQHADGTFPAGVALPITQARVRIADFDQTLPRVAGRETGDLHGDPTGRTHADCRRRFWTPRATSCAAPTMSTCGESERLTATPADTIQTLQKSPCRTDWQSVPAQNGMRTVTPRPNITGGAIQPELAFSVSQR